MKKINRLGIHALTVAAALLGMTVSTRAAIESKFDDGIYPAGISNGWASAWAQTFGTPIFRTNSPRPSLDGTSPYIHLNATGGNNRNLRRQAQNALGVNFAVPHYIRWKFRLDDTNFVANFTLNTDRVHFFGRNAAATASTDSSVSWMIFGAGAAANGISGGKTFWTCNAFNDSAAYDTTTAIDTGVAITPFHIYSFEVYVIPELKGYYLSITNETTPSSFYNSASIQKFRNVTAPIDSFTFLHFGTAASGTTEVRPFDLDSVTITPWNGPAVEIVKPLPYAIHKPWETIQIIVSSLGSISGSDIGVTLNGTNANPFIINFGPNVYSANCSGLATNADYEMIVSATNGVGIVNLTNKFYTYDTTVALYDSEGFTNEILYPDAYPSPLPLQAVTHGKSTWAPDANEPSLILSNDTDGRVLQRGNSGASEMDFLHLPPISSGRIIFEFDVKVSDPARRTIDVSLMPLLGSQMTGFLMWGTNKVHRYDGVNWQPLADLNANRHSFKMVHHLSGPAAGYYDVFVDNVLVGEKLPWAAAVSQGTALSRLRLQSHAEGQQFQYAWLDNLVVTAAPEDPNAVPPPTVVAVTPANDSIVRPNNGLQFTATSILPIYSTNIGLSLNGLNVSGALAITGTATATNRSASYSALQAETNYSAIMTATNAGGVDDAMLSFISTEQPWLYHPSDGWVAGWQFTSGLPQMRTDNAFGTGPYVHYDLVGFGARNGMRQYGSSANVNVSLPHTVRWKFRMPEDDFNANFVTFDDRVHFFGRSAPRLTAGTDGSTSWSISATGNEQTAGSGVSAGQKFYIFDNLDLTSAYNLNNLVDSGIQVFPHNIYAFEVTFFPSSETYSVKITNETSSAFFVSASPHKYRAAGVTGSSHNMLHFGVQANSAATQRSWDLGAVTFTAVPVSVTLTNPVYAGGNFSFSFQSQAGINHIVKYVSDITSSSWTSLLTNQGNGNLMTVTHTNAPTGPLYYRVESAQP